MQIAEIKLQISDAGPTLHMLGGIVNYSNSFETFRVNISSFFAKDSEVIPEKIACYSNSSTFTTPEIRSNSFVIDDKSKKLLLTCYISHDL